MTQAIQYPRPLQEPAKKIKHGVMRVLIAPSMVGYKVFVIEISFLDSRNPSFTDAKLRQVCNKKISCSCSGSLTSTKRRY